jgi:hypothetical protein
MEAKSRRLQLCSFSVDVAVTSPKTSLPGSAIALHGGCRTKQAQDREDALLPSAETKRPTGSIPNLSANTLLAMRSRIGVLRTDWLCGAPYWWNPLNAKIIEFE